VTVNRVPALNFVHVDHLNSPRLIADAAGATVWRHDNAEPFGSNPPDENPGGLGAFEFPLRFAGQYADKETNLHYNYFRDCYDPATGRYCEADPIGSSLFGDQAVRSLGRKDIALSEQAALLLSPEPKYNHLYSYADNSPLNKADPFGLMPQLSLPPSEETSSRGENTVVCQTIPICTLTATILRGEVKQCLYSCGGRIVPYTVSKYMTCFNKMSFF
jgi:RHS repeat-associated protein